MHADLIASTANSGDVTGLAGLVVDIMDKLGVWGAGIASALDSVIPIIPSEVVLPIVGLTASQGSSFGLVEALIAVNIGSVVGGLILYYLSLGFGRDRLAWLIEKTPLLKIDDLERAERWFGRWGSWAVFLARMVPGVRCLISIPAGIERMPVVRFAVLTLLGSGIWNSLLVYAGFALGDNWHVIEPYMSWFSRVVVVALIAVVCGFVWVRVRELRRGEL